MYNEIIKLLDEDKELSQQNSSIDEINDEKELSDLIKKIGSNKVKLEKKNQIAKNLNGELFKDEIYIYKEVVSTNNVAKFLAGNGAPEGTVIISKTQTKGKGTRGRQWKSPEGGTWLTIILRPEFTPSKAPLLTLATGVAVAKTLRKYDLNAEIKWPNDILINGKKISGILTEANAKFATLDYVVVGVGIDSNVDLDKISFLDNYEITSIKNELQEDIDENKLIAEFLNEFETIYNELKENNFKDMLYRWRRLSNTIGNFVEIHQPLGKTLKGYAIGINKKGALIIEQNNGELKKILSGEVINRDKINKD
jgi:BirA family biotin operon repressor/biotin-[acetyl-CoA-carboxylase] ligase